ncbi:MAG: M24 family metallopeptidase [Chloroflexi bacterium]|nr:M24 family metallopeptidase [Chloroflexota bacterium]
MIFPLRQQTDIRRQWLSARLQTILPEIMRREGFDMWIISAREYNEDPVLLSLLPEPAIGARRRTILLFAFTPEGHFEALALDRYGYPGFYTAAWNPGDEAQFDCLARLVRRFDPQRIALNFSQTFAFGDGLSHHEYTLLAAALGQTYLPRVASGERLAVGWLERRIPAEIAAYSAIVALGHDLIRHAYSRAVIHPGLTTTHDVVWWLRQRIHDLGLRAWFHPTVEIQAPGQAIEAPAPGMNRTPARNVILPGDLLHCDVGFIYLGLATDQQQHAYVLRPAESAPPPGLEAALRTGNRLQDILMQHMQPGKSGNAVLRAALAQAAAEGIDASIYSHPLGYHGHAAGPTIGLWDQQQGVPGSGDYPLFDDTAYSIELNIKQAVPEWNQQIVRIALEEDAVLSAGAMRWLAGRQTQLHLID